MLVCMRKDNDPKIDNRKQKTNEKAITVKEIRYFCLLWKQRKRIGCIKYL